MGESTILEKRPINGGQHEKTEGGAWKQVTLGGVSGILMGAGLLYAGQLVAHELGREEKKSEVEIPEQGQTSHILENGLKVAAVDEDLSFGEAFAQARAEVGPGGIFHWHGGIYNTYTAAEWNSMTVEQKHEFAEQVQPEIKPNELSTPTDTDTHVVVVHHVYRHEDNSSVEGTLQASGATDDVQVASQQTIEEGGQDSDVHIVGYANVDGHLAVGYDMTGDGQTDVVIIDMDDNRQLSDADLIVDREGNMATVGEVVNAQDPNQMTTMENPDVEPDMPDYINDAMIDV